MAHRSTAPRRRLLRAAVPGVAADAVRRRNQRGASRCHRPARSRDAVVRTVTPCERLLDQDERDLAAMCRSLLAAEPDDRRPRLHMEGAGRRRVSLGLAIRRRARRIRRQPDRSRRLLRRGGTCVVSHRRAQHVNAACAVDWLGDAGKRGSWLPAWRPAPRAHHGAVEPARCFRRDAAATGAPRGGPLEGRAASADFVADADLADVIVVSADADGRGRLRRRHKAAGIRIEPCR